MGEYAKRIIDDKYVKIGTCDSMYYCRYEQKDDVDYGYPTDNFFWRIPTPEEDYISVGDFDYPLFKGHLIPCLLRLNTYRLSSEDISFMISEYGTLQMKDETSGLIVSLKCPHGFPVDRCGFKKGGDFVKGMFYNGYQSPIYLYALKNEDKELRVVARCASCGAMWSFSFSEIVNAIDHIWMKLRLLHQCADYHYVHSQESSDMKVSANDMLGRCMVISPSCLWKWRVDIDGGECISGDWYKCRNFFISSLPDPRNNYIEYYMNKLAFQSEDMRSRYLSK